MGVRDSTLAHMHQMLATATAVATASSCTPEVQQTVTITPLPTQPTTADPTPPLPPPTASATFNAPVPLPPPPPDPSGYLVVDMLPAPARCIGLANASKATAKFHRDGSGIVIDLVVTLPTAPPMGATFTGTPPTVMSGTIVSFAYRSHSTVATARVRPVPQTVQNVGASFPVTCTGGANGNGTMFAHASFSGTPAEGASVNVTLTDY